MLPGEIAAGGVTRFSIGWIAALEPGEVHAQRAWDDDEEWDEEDAFDSDDDLGDIDYPSDDEGRRMLGHMAMEDDHPDSFDDSRLRVHGR